MKKILIVDDQPEVCELVSVTLEIGPYQIFTANNSASALQIARQERPDLMLLDIQLIGSAMDGLQICETLKHEETTSHTHIIMLTAKGQEWDKQLGYDKGADGYFVKPFSPLELINRVETVLA